MTVSTYTRSTLPKTVLTGNVPVSILRCVFVAVCAVSFVALKLAGYSSTYLSNIDAPLNVHLLGHRLQMIRVDAAPNAAQVIQPKFIGDRSNQHQISHAVRQFRTSSFVVQVHIKTPIAIVVKASNPEPATAHRLRDELRVQPSQRIEYSGCHGERLTPHFEFWNSTFGV